MTLPNANPLANYFRTPGLHTKIPTEGRFMPPGSISFTMTGDLPVFPMAAKDELLLKSPDALISGLAIEELIKSCIPNITQPRMVSTQDLDVLFLAIRAATYGPVMSMDAECPQCNTVSEIDCNLAALLSTMEMVDADNEVALGDDILVYVRPYNLHNATMLAEASYTEARKLQAVEEASATITTADRNRAVNQSMDVINKLNLELLIDCIIRIVIPGNTVESRSDITEFINNIPKPWVESINDKLKVINGKGIDKHVQVKCSNSECGNEWKTEVEFNPSNFFDAASLR